MDKLASKLIPLLESEGMKFRIYGNRIRVALPNNFGELEIGNLGDNDTIIGIPEGDSGKFGSHTHADILRETYDEDSDEGAVLTYLKLIFAGEILLIEERKNGVTLRKYIQELFLEFSHSYVDDEGVEVIVHNEKGREQA